MKIYYVISHTQITVEITSVCLWTVITDENLHFYRQNICSVQVSTKSYNGNRFLFKIGYFVQSFRLWRVFGVWYRFFFLTLKCRDQCATRFCSPLPSKSWCNSFLSLLSFSSIDEESPIKGKVMQVQNSLCQKKVFLH